MTLRNKVTSGRAITTTAMRCLSAAVICLAIVRAGHAQVPPLHLLARIAMPGVIGRIDHMALDREHNRLFVAALGNNSLEVLDLKKRTRIKTIAGFSEPQGVVFIPATNRVVIANGGDGSCLVLDAATYRPLARINLFLDADDLRYDADEQRLYVAYGRGAIGIFNAGLKEVGNIKLPGHPEGFAVDPDNGRLYANVPLIHSVAVLDLGRQRVASAWRLPYTRSNYPLALDRASHLLAVATRAPAQLVGLDTRSGKIVFQVPSDGDADDIYFDTGRRRIYLSCGAGFIDVFKKTANGSYRLAHKIATAPGARTSLFVPELRRLFLAVPAHGSHAAAIWIYAT